MGGTPCAGDIHHGLKVRYSGKLRRFLESSIKYGCEGEVAKEGERRGIPPLIGLCSAAESVQDDQSGTWSRRSFRGFSSSSGPLATCSACSTADELFRVSVLSGRFFFFFSASSSSNANQKRQLCDPQPLALYLGLVSSC